MNPKSSLRRVAILGGGFAGAMTAFNIAKLNSNLEIVVIEPRAELGLGAAYSTARGCHLLNVQAERMGAEPGNAQEFFRWLQHQQLPLRGDSFAPRQQYGNYLRTKMQELPPTSVRHLRSKAISVSNSISGAYEIRLDDDRPPVTAEVLVIALGNQLPEEVNGIREIHNDPLLLSDPWAEGASNAVASSEHVTIIGTGLTAVDVVLDAVERVVPGQLLLISRRGLLPRPHLAESFTSTIPATTATTLRAVTRELRVLARSYPWQAVVDSIRGRTQALWQGFTSFEQRQFLRHVRPYWEVHRHRIPVESARTLNRLIESGTLKVAAGRIVSARRSGNALRIDWTPKGGGEVRTVDTRLVINCAGPASLVGSAAPPVVKSLFEAGIAVSDSLKLGLAVDPRQRLVRADGRIAESAFGLGSVARGTFWECTAVRELRDQALSVATEISTLESRGALNAT